jgi:Skp family chaperone for outer membrane proteins
MRAASVAVLSFALVNLGLMSSVQAAIIDTGALVQTSRDADLVSIRTQLERADVKAQMEKMGVSASTVDQRVASLSDSELHRLAQGMQHAPVGGDGLLAVLGVVFIVLLILEVIGVIDIFKRNPGR